MRDIPLKQMKPNGFHVFLKTEWRKLLLLLCMCLLYFFSYFQRIAVPGTCFDELQRDFKTTAAAITALGSIFLYIYGFAQFFIGILADRFGGKRTMLVGASVLVSASILFPLSGSLSMLYLTRAVLAAGASTIFLSLVKEIDSLFHPRHFAIWLGVAVFIGYSGGIAGTYPLERAISHFGWRNAMLGTGLLCLLALTTAVIIFHKIPVSRAQNSSPEKIYLGAVFKNPASYPPLIVGAINFSVYFLFQATIGKKMLSDCCGLSSAQAASMIFFMIIVCTGFASASGLISRLIGNRRKPIILTGAFLMLAASASLAFFIRDHPDYRFISAGFIIFAMAASPSPITLSAIKEVNPGPAAATSVGLANCAAYVVMAIIINLAGLVMDCFKEQAVITAERIIYPLIAYRLILAGCAVLSIISVTAALFVRETKGAPSHRTG
jgi:predicted MFS family arabinose efflux permease